MKTFCISIVILWNFINFSNANSCKISRRKMDCTGLNLTYCPLVNSTILTLILDDNSLKDFNSPNCQNWTQLRSLIIRRNHLTSFLISNFLLLENLDLSQNKLISINSESIGINFINLSYNLISDQIKLEYTKLKHLIINNNHLSNDGIKIVIDNIHQSPSISLLDVSYNKFDKSPNSLMSLSPNRIISINISGNLLPEFDFDTNLNKGVNFDLSFNKIVDISATVNNSVLKLNLSHNQLTKIDVNKLDTFVHLQQLDLSGNPLNCLCSESESFIRWLINNKDKIVQKTKTICDKPEKKSIFDVKCTNGSTTPSVITSTPPHPFTSNVPIKDKTWAIVVPILVLIIIVGIGIYIYYKRRKSSGYHRIGESPNSSPLFGCDCLPMLSFRSRRNTRLIVDEENIQHTFSENRLNFEVTLNVICCKKDRKWISRDITCHLDIKKNIISTKVKNLPYGDFTLIVVNGDNCFNDYTFMINAEMSLNTNDRKDIRLLINTEPKFENSRKNSSFIDFIKDRIDKNSYFQYNANEINNCLSCLKIWLKLDYIPHNV